MAYFIGKKGLFGIGVMGLVLALAFSSTRFSNFAGAQMPGGPQGPMPVLVEIAKPEPVRIWSEFSGRLTPVDYAVIRPQVTGTITEIRFEDGQHVEKGDVLMVIDPRAFDAALLEAKANLASAQSAHELAQAELARAESLIKTNAISEKILDERKTKLKSAKAAIEAAKAHLKQAEVDHDHAYVKAPITGRVGRAELTVGNVAQAAPMLTSIVSDSGIYADFEVDEQTYIRTIRSTARDKAAEQLIPVQVVLGNDESNPIEGHIHTFDNHIDQASGTIRARALVPNADNALLPGMYVRVRLGSPTEAEHIMVTEKAVGTDQDRRFVYVVDETNTVKYRQVSLGESVLGRRVVLDGLKAGEKVIAEGIIKIRPEMPVKPMSAEEMQAMQKQQEEAAKAAAAQQGAASPPEDHH